MATVFCVRLSWLQTSVGVKCDNEVMKNAPPENLPERTLGYFHSIRATRLLSGKGTHQSCPALRRILRDPGSGCPGMYERKEVAKGMDRAFVEY